MRAVAATRDTDNERKRRLLMVMVYLMAIVVAATVSAQRPKGNQDPKLKPRPVTLKTKDGLQLRAYYFPSDKGKEAIPVLLIHEWKGNASPYVKLVVALRDAGCAVLVPEYRGHGGSKEYTNARGVKDKFNVNQMSKRDIDNIIRLDIEKGKSFLKGENDAEKLNLNALVVIGVREGCVLAAHWAQRDWSFPSVGRMKQGQDVKCLVFISPQKQIKGVGIDPTLSNPNLLRLPIMIVAGEQSPEASEAKRIAKRIESIKKRMGRGVASGFELRMVDTPQGGSRLVRDVSSVIPAITKFVTSHVSISEDENPWIERN
jgi:hypothetical protein